MRLPIAGPVTLALACALLPLACEPPAPEEGEGEGDAAEGEGEEGEGDAAEGEGEEGEGEGDTCIETSDCALGSICIDDGLCLIDDRGPYCAFCTPGSDDCGGNGNFCLTSSEEDGYCGVDCTAGQECPSGFACSDIAIASPAAPLCGAELCQDGVCSTSGGECVLDEDCPLGPPQGNCVEQRAGRAGNCSTDPFGDCDDDGDCADGTCLLTQCVGGEGDAIGRCTCTTNADCPQDACDGAKGEEAGACELTGRVCFGDDDCDPIVCIDGGCLIGANCVPEAPLTCRDVFVP